MSKRLSGVRAKIERAKKHIADLAIVDNSFNNSKPHSIRTKDDPQTGQKIFYLASTRDIPGDIALIAGDAIHNLRSTLDHLATQLHGAGIFKAGVPLKYAHFPFYDSASEYKSQRPGIVKSTRKDVMDAIDASEPYQGGNDSLWALHKLDNIDKHELLFAAACTNFVTAVGVPFEDAGPIYGGYAPSTATAEPLPTFTPVKALCPLKLGDELLRTDPYPDIEKNVNFIIGIAFAEPQIVQGKPVLPFLHQLADLVSGIVVRFESLL
jgi:hypothetical protein